MRTRSRETKTGLVFTGVGVSFSGKVKNCSYEYIHCLWFSRLILVSRGQCELAIKWNAQWSLSKETANRNTDNVNYDNKRYGSFSISAGISSYPHEQNGDTPSLLQNWTCSKEQRMWLGISMASKSFFTTSRLLTYFTINQTLTLYERGQFEKMYFCPKYISVINSISTIVREITIKPDRKWKLKSKN
jgi:hypothetical protein